MDPLDHPAARMTGTGGTIFVRAALVAAVAVLVAGAAPARAEIYMWRDARGVIHFSDRKQSEKYQKKAPGRLEPVAAHPQTKVARANNRYSEVDHAELNSWVSRYSDEFGVDPDLVRAVIHAESDYNYMAVSRAGAMGLMQLMPGTADHVGVNDAFDPEANVRGGTKYIAMMLDRFQNNVKLAVAAYNAGPENVVKYRGVPPFDETRAYVKRVMLLFETYRQQRLWASKPDAAGNALTSAAPLEP